MKILNFLKSKPKESSTDYFTKHSLKPISKRECPMCGFRGWFGFFGRPPRLDAQCPNCKSLERHRLLYLAFERGEIPTTDSNLEPLLHFAPEKIFETYFRSKFNDYKTADLFQPADLKLNLENIELPANSQNCVVASHVLEHVDDYKASCEIARILKPGGILIAMVPIIEGWKNTYENNSVDSDEDRWIHFGQNDHIRYYGRDFRNRLQKSGLVLESEITAESEDVIKYGLHRGEKVFLFKKPSVGL